jgi:hypothetical protein
LEYKIDFWNKEDAPAATLDVYITDELDPDLDWETLSFTEIGFLKWKAPLEGGQYFDVDVDMRPDEDLIVNVVGMLDPVSGELRWEFHTLDPATREPPEDPFAGFLPPITASGYEIGWVKFTVGAKSDLLEGTRIENQSYVKFDLDVFKPAPPGGPWVNTIGDPADMRADVNCDESNDVDDVIGILRFVADLDAETQRCAVIGAMMVSLRMGDVNCNGQVTSADALALLLAEAGQPPIPDEDCPMIGASAAAASAADGVVPFSRRLAPRPGR